MSEQSESWRSKFNRYAKEIVAGAKEFRSMTNNQKILTGVSGVFTAASLLTASPVSLLVWGGITAGCLKTHGNSMIDKKNDQSGGPQEP